MNTPIQLHPCPKAYTRDLDKCVSPRQTIERVRQALADSGLDVLAETRRVDTGRLGIPVYLSVCGRDARRIMPTRKQMGKGSSAEQAQASALMELMERYAFFSFWEARPQMVTATWQEAERRFREIESLLREKVPGSERIIVEKTFSLFLFLGEENRGTRLGRYPEPLRKALEILHGSGIRGNAGIPHLKNSLHNAAGFRIDNQMIFVFRVLQVSIHWIFSHKLSLLFPSLKGSSDFL